MHRMTDEEYARFLEMQRAEARREMEGRAQGKTAQKLLSHPTVARDADGIGAAPDPLVSEGVPGEVIDGAN